MRVAPPWLISIPLAVRAVCSDALTWYFILATDHSMTRSKGLPRSARCLHSLYSGEQDKVCCVHETEEDFQQQLLLFLLLLAAAAKALQPRPSHLPKPLPNSMKDARLSEDAANWSC